jgi:hypothetical protein
MPKKDKWKYCSNKLKKLVILAENISRFKVANFR